MNLHQVLTGAVNPGDHCFSVCGDCAPDGTCSLVRSPAYPGLGVVTGPRWSPVYDQRPSWCRTKKLGLMCLVPLENKRGSGVCNQGFNRPSYEKSRVPAWIQTQPFVWIPGKNNLGFLGSSDATGDLLDQLMLHENFIWFYYVASELPLSVSRELFESTVFVVFI